MQMRNLQRGQVCSHCRRFRRATAPAPSEFRDIAGDLRPRLEERATTPNWPMKTDLFCWALTKGHSELTLALEGLMASSLNAGPWEPCPRVHRGNRIQAAPFRRTPPARPLVLL